MLIYESPLIDIVIKVLSDRMVKTKECYTLQEFEGKEIVDLGECDYNIILELNEFGCKIEHLSLQFGRNNKYYPKMGEFEIVEHKIFNHFHPQQILKE